MNYRYSLLLIIIMALAACRQKNEQAEKNDEIPALENNHTISKMSEDFITDTLFNFKIIQKTDKYIDSITNHKHGIAFLINEDENDENIIHVKAGFNGAERFETYYNLSISKLNKEITIMDPVSAEEMPLQEYKEEY